MGPTFWWTFCTATLTLLIGVGVGWWGHNFIRGSDPFLRGPGLTFKDWIDVEHARVHREDLTDPE